MNNKNVLIKIVVSILIVAIIAGIWFFKNTKKEIPTSSKIQNDFSLEVNSIDLETLQSYGVPIIIDFGADSCIPCKEMAPVLKKLNKEMKDKAIIKFVDVWKYPDAVAEFPVQVIPTQVIYTADGEPYTPSEDLEIEVIMYHTNDTDEHLFTVHQGGLSEEQMRSILKDMGVE